MKDKQNQLIEHEDSTVQMLSLEKDSFFASSLYQVVVAISRNFLFRVSLGSLSLNYELCHLLVLLQYYKHKRSLIINLLEDPKRAKVCMTLIQFHVLLSSGIMEGDDAAITVINIYMTALQAAFILAAGTSLSTYSDYDGNQCHNDHCRAYTIKYKHDCDSPRTGECHACCKNLHPPTNNRTYSEMDLGRSRK